MCVRGLWGGADIDACGAPQQGCQVGTWTQYPNLCGISKSLVVAHMESRRCSCDSVALSPLTQRPLTDVIVCFKIQSINRKLEAQ